MKSFLAFITESELAFYLESVQDYSEYKEWLKTELIIEADYSRLNNKIKIINELVAQGYNRKSFSDKITFKFFNSIDWDLVQFDEARIRHNTKELSKLVEAWSSAIISNYIIIK